MSDNDKLMYNIALILITIIIITTGLFIMGRIDDLSEVTQDTHRIVYEMWTERGSDE